MRPGRLPISAIVVSRSEGVQLARCLPAIRFCDDLLLVDLASQDDTAEVARRNGARVVEYDAADSVERVRAAVVGQARHDWLLLTDPDEEVPPALAGAVAAFLDGAPADVALVYAPIRYRFGSRALRGGVWGGIKERRFLVRRSGAEFSATIYAGVRPRPGFRAESIPFDGENAIDHHWVSGFHDFFAKHRRYVRVSAEDRADAGEITGLKAIAIMPLRAFVDAFAWNRGYRDGLLGLALAVLWAWYSTSAELALRRRLAH